MLASQLEVDLKELLEELLSYRNQDLIRREELGEKHCLKGIDKPAKQALSIFPGLTLTESLNCQTLRTPV